MLFFKFSYKISGSHQFFTLTTADWVLRIVFTAVMYLQFYLSRDRLITATGTAIVAISSILRRDERKTLLQSNFQDRRSKMQKTKQIYKASSLQCSSKHYQSITDATCVHAKAVLLWARKYEETEKQTHKAHKSQCVYYSGGRQVLPRVHTDLWVYPGPPIVLYLVTTGHFSFSFFVSHHFASSTLGLIILFACFFNYQRYRR